MTGWTARTGGAPTRPGKRHVLEIRTPTGHSYRSTAPPLPGTHADENGDRLAMLLDVAGLGVPGSAGNEFRQLCLGFAD